MTTSQTASLSKPIGVTRIPSSTFGYFRARNKRRAYNLVIREFKKSGLSQADLAKRTGKGADRISRLIGGPGNWTLDTISDLLFAISGGEPVYSVAYPLDKPARNDTRPDWLFSAGSNVRASNGAFIELFKTAPPQTNTQTHRITP